MRSLLARAALMSAGDASAGDASVDAPVDGTSGASGSDGSLVLL